MAEKSEIITMPLDELRLHVQGALELETWPGDWQAAGLIIERHSVRLHRASFMPYTYTAVISALKIGGGIAGGSDANPVAAIFRAYLAWLSKKTKVTTRTRDK